MDTIKIEDVKFSRTKLKKASNYGIQIEESVLIFLINIGTGYVKCNLEIHLPRNIIMKIINTM